MRARACCSVSAPVVLTAGATSGWVDCVAQPATASTASMTRLNRFMGLLRHPAPAAPGFVADLSGQLTAGGVDVVAPRPARRGADPGPQQHVPETRDGLGSGARVPRVR